MNIIYLACVIISLIIYFSLYLTDVKRSLFQNVMLLIILISSLGFWNLTNAKNLEEAILATKIGYISGCFIPMLYFLTISEICRVKIHKYFIIAMIVVQGLIFTCVCTIGYSDIYYKSVRYIANFGHPYLQKQYGWTHIFYPVSMTLYFISSVVCCICTLIKNKTVDRKELITVIFTTFLAFIFYWVTYSKVYSFSGVTNIILILGVILPVYHLNLYTAYENKDVISEQLSEIGFITFDKKLRFRSGNSYAEEIFPLLKDCSVGQVINTKRNSKLLKTEREAREELEKIVGLVESFKLKIQEESIKGHIHSEQKDTFKHYNQTFEYEIHTVNNLFKKIVGYTIVFSDETVHYNNLKIQKNFNEELNRQVAEKTQKIREIQKKTVLGMAQIVESRDKNTGGHVKRTSDVVKIFVKKIEKSGYDYDKEILRKVVRSAPMHDLGKIGIDDAILRKEGKFDPQEREKMNQHAVLGKQLVEEFLRGVEEDDFVQVAENVAHYHHEKIDGKGYPEGLSGENIPLEARIMALADVFDALVSKRCYKEAMTFDEAFKIIEDDAGTHFDSTLASIFLNCRGELEDYYKKCSNED